MVEALGKQQKKKKSYVLLVGKYEGKRSLGRRRHVCKYTLKMTFKEMGWEFVGWVHMAQESVK